LHEIPDELEATVLKDNNLLSIKDSPVFITNKSPDTPTNRISTSLFSHDRLAFVLEFGLTYVKTEAGLGKTYHALPSDVCNQSD
jgi:type I restriction enzyme R subunit